MLGVIGLAAGVGLAFGRLMMAEPARRDRIVIGALSILWLAAAAIFGIQQITGKAPQVDTWYGRVPRRSRAASRA